MHATATGSVEYLQHHLHNLRWGSGFWSLDLDTLAIGWTLAALLIVVSWRMGLTLSIERPSRLQNAFEMVIEFINRRVAELFPGRNPLIGPLALTLFLWVLLMNAMDLFPVDLVPALAATAGAPYWRAVPTTDLGTTFGLALCVFALVTYYNAKVKGAAGLARMFLLHPFGPWLAPINLVMTLIEEIAKPISLALRLFGNMFAGELIFLLITLLAVGGFGVLWLLALVLGTGWAIFHVLVVALQAFIFTLLTVVYLGMAHADFEHH